MNAPISWLLEGDPWVVYRTRLDLLGQSERATEVKTARAAMLDHPQVRGLVAELAGWPGMVIASHKSAGQPFHKLVFLADLGLRAGDPGIDRVIACITKRQSAEGPHQLPVNVPVHFGGTGRDTWAWALCDAPLVAYALVRFGLKTDPAVRRAIAHLAGLSRDNGWPCAVSKELGSFRGPGRKDDPCPFATLIMLKLASELDEYRDGAAARAGAGSLLSLWADSRARHPYMFFMGTDFRKLKVPFIWYDLINVLDVLTRFAWLRDDPRLRDMASILIGKADPDGRFTWSRCGPRGRTGSLGRKAPSPWLTLAAWRVLSRLQPVPAATI
jgi:hypothetical protein